MILQPLIGAPGIWGHPWHGLVKGGRLPLPAGTSPTWDGAQYVLPSGHAVTWNAAAGVWELPYPQPAGTRYGEFGRALRVRRPGWSAPVRDLAAQARDSAGGRQWRGEALLSGLAGQLYGRATGAGWLYCAPDASRWHIGLGSLSYPGATGCRLAVTLQRFGELGQDPVAAIPIDVDFAQSGIEGVDWGALPISQHLQLAPGYALEDVNSAGSEGVISLRVQTDPAYWPYTVWEYSPKVAGVLGWARGTHQRAVAFLRIAVGWDAGQQRPVLTGDCYADFATTLGPATVTAPGPSLVAETPLNLPSGYTWARLRLWTVSVDYQAGPRLAGLFYGADDTLQEITLSLSVHNQASATGSLVGSTGTIPDAEGDHPLLDLTVDENISGTWALSVAVGGAVTTYTASATQSKSASAHGWWYADTARYDATEDFSTEWSVHTDTGVYGNSFPFSGDGSEVVFDYGFSAALFPVVGGVARNLELGYSTLIDFLAGTGDSYTEHFYEPLLLRPSNRLSVSGLYRESRPSGGGAAVPLYRWHEARAPGAVLTDFASAADLRLYGSYDPVTSTIVAAQADPVCFV